MDHGTLTHVRQHTDEQDTRQQKTQKMHVSKQKTHVRQGWTSNPQILRLISLSCFVSHQPSSRFVSFQPLEFKTLRIQPLEASTLGINPEASEESKVEVEESFVSDF